MEFDLTTLPSGIVVNSAELQLNTVTRSSILHTIEFLASADGPVLPADFYASSGALCQSLVSTPAIGINTINLGIPCPGFLEGLLDTSAAYAAVRITPFAGALWEIGTTEGGLEQQPRLILNVTQYTIPQPTTPGIFAFGLAGLGFMRRRRQATA